MAQNTTPIFALTPNISWTTAVTAANTAYDGTGTVNLVFTGATNGSMLHRVRFQPLASNAATLGRLFLNNGATNTTAANNTLIAEVGLPASTTSNTLPIPPFELVLNLWIPNTYRIYFTLATAVAGGYICTGFGGDY